MDASLVNEPKIEAWLRLLADAGCEVRRAEPLSVLRKRNGELLFALLDTEVLPPDLDRPLPRYVFIRGDACVIVPLLRNRDTGEEKFLMVRQRRIGSGHVSLEFPAGMLDDEVHAPIKVAVREFAEETGIPVTEGELFPLWGQKLFSSSGASDEGIFYYGCVKTVDGPVWQSVGAAERGNAEEGESIEVALLSMEEAIREATSVQVLLGFYLFGEHSRRVRLPAGP